LGSVFFPLPVWSGAGFTFGAEVRSKWSVPKRDRCECLHCKEFFVPNRRNWWHQKYCTKPECRKASKAQSQRRWLSKPENRDAFGGSANVERVRQWRAKNPDYWKRQAKTAGTLQELVPTQAAENKEVVETTSALPLQDFVASQDPMVLGLIAHLVDSPLQDVVEQAARRLLQKGQSILDMRSGMKPKGNPYADKETSAVPGTAPKSSGPVQLGGPSPGAPALHPTL
jgi:hypothetical protein